MKTKKSMIKFNTTKFDKVVKVRSNHVLGFELGKEITVDGRKFNIVNVLNNFKKTYFIFLELIKNNEIK